MRLNARLFFLTLFVLHALTGCASNAIYHDNYAACDVSNEQLCESHTLQKHHIASDSEYLLGFVEIDDQGQLRDRAQMQAVLDSLYSVAARHSLLVNVFVHGWHHNAENSDSNIIDFRTNMKLLSKMESDLSAKQERVKRKIVGIYVGWRGESIDLPAINMLTFWDRKNTAEEVGQLGMTELLFKLEEIVNVKNAQSSKVKNRLVVVGHSFGGAAVYSATSQILAARFVNSSDNKNHVGDADGFGDLVVLLNPAFEALRYAPLYDLAQARCSYFSSQRPTLAILTSEADYATKLAFPAGRFFYTMFETHGDVERSDCNRPYTLDEGEADRTTVGHFKPLLSHTLIPVDKHSKKTVSIENLFSTWSKQVSGDATTYDGTVLTHLGKTAPRNPFLNIKVDKRLSADHNDVFGVELMNFVRSLILLSTDDSSLSNQ